MQEEMEVLQSSRARVVPLANISAEVPVQVKIDLIDLARRDGVSLSNVIREAIQAHLLRAA